jgi:hypothetical protein
LVSRSLAHTGFVIISFLRILLFSLIALTMRPSTPSYISPPSLSLAHMRTPTHTRSFLQSV